PSAGGPLRRRRTGRPHPVVRPGRLRRPVSALHAARAVADQPPGRPTDRPSRREPARVLAHEEAAVSRAPHTSRLLARGRPSAAAGELPAHPGPGDAPPRRYAARIP